MSRGLINDLSRSWYREIVWVYLANFPEWQFGDAKHLIS